ncbi:MAG: lipoyl synthase, partial [Austwickia sp.]|nr:lipoyl synthase [Austwickia sp.]
MSVTPEGRRLLRVEARNSETPIERKPSWIRTTAKMGPEYSAMSSLVKDGGLHTVCQEAGCPNIFECWEDREATFLIGGDICTRRCDFCDIATGRPAALDTDEPRRVAESVRQLGLRYATVTGVARDDLPDGAAGLYAETIRAIHAANPTTGVEILPPDFGARPELVGQVFDAGPEVFAHNLETV